MKIFMSRMNASGEFINGPVLGNFLSFLSKKKIQFHHCEDYRTGIIEISINTPAKPIIDEYKLSDLYIEVLKYSRGPIDIWFEDVPTCFTEGFRAIDLS